MSVSAPSKSYTVILRDKRKAPPGLSSVAEWLSAWQGFYYVVTGLWPLIHMDSFIAVTGPKTDLWLVRGVGMLVLVIGIVFLMAAVRSVLSLELGVLMAGTSAGFSALEILYTVRGVLPPIYLADAFEEIAVLVLALAFLPRFSHRRHSTFV
jgi:hypothetical protein